MCRYRWVALSNTTLGVLIININYSTAIITDAFGAHQRGMALGINQVAAIAGSFLGLLLGGVLAEWDWHAVFWVNVPIGILGTAWAYRSLRETATARRRGSLDWPGN